MKICVFGAGAIGGLIAGRLAARGEAEVSVVARGAHLAAIRAGGLTLVSAAGAQAVPVAATDDTAVLGAQDFVILGVKAHAVPGLLVGLRPLLGPQTAVVTAQNGVPWWYFHAHGGPYEGRRVEAVDPGGRIWDAIGPERAIGCVVYPAAEIAAPGVIRHVDGDRLPLGEPSGDRTPRVAALSAALVAAGFKAPVRPRIRAEIWVKLWGNLAFNPISALTVATLAQICADAGSRGVARAMMLEGQALAEALGIQFGIDVDRRIAGAAEVGAHKTSMLQDLEAGRPLETGALVTAVQELAGVVGIPTPTIDTVAALLALRASG